MVHWQFLLVTPIHQPPWIALYHSYPAMTSHELAGSMLWITTLKHWLTISWSQINNRSISRSTALWWPQWTMNWPPIKPPLCHQLTIESIHHDQHRFTKHFPLSNHWFCHRPLSGEERALGLGSRLRAHHRGHALHRVAAGEPRWWMMVDVDGLSDEVVV